MPAHASNNRYEAGDTIYIALDGVAVQTDYTNFNVSESTDIAEASAGSDRDKTYIPTMKDATFSLESMQQVGSGGSALRAKMVNGARGTLVYGPEGTATGKPEYSCRYIITGVEVSYPRAEMVQHNISIQRDGAWLAHYEASGDVF